MKNLILLNDDTNIKLGDTGTLMQFKANNNNAPVFLQKSQTATFRIKNALGFLKSVNAETTMSGYVFQFDTSKLDGLVPGTYQLELALNKTSDDVDIYPDKGFVQFTITENSLSITGEQLPVMSLDDFKQQAQEYITSQSDALQSNFDNYVAEVKTGPQGEQGKSASVYIGNVTTVDSSQQASVTNSGTETDVTLNFGIPKGEKGDKGDPGPVDTQAITVANEAKTTADNATEQVTSGINDLNTQISTLKGSLNAVPNNLMPDASFSQELADNFVLSKDSNTTIEVISCGYNGDNSLKINATSQTSNVYYGVQIKPDKFLRVNAGDHYSLGAVVKASDLDATAKIEVNFYNSSKSRVNKTGIVIDNPIGSNWVPVKLEDFVVPSGVVYMNVNFFVYKNGTLEVAHPELIYGGTVPSSWLSSVSDLSKQIANLQSQINALKG